MSGIRCMLMRGGSSKGAYFLKADLPLDEAERDDLLLRVMGSPDPRQVDGLGGAHPLTSKVAIVSKAIDDLAEIDFLFVQVSVDQALVDTTPNCGNILAGVGPFAIERGLVPANDPVTPVRVRTVNTGTIAELLVSTPGGKVCYDGSERIDGVPGAAASLPINFLDAAGAVCGALLPTSSVLDRIEGVDVTCIDNGMPVVIMRAADVGLRGDETCAELEASRGALEKIEAIRQHAAKRMGMGDVSEAVVPKVSLISPARHGGAIQTRNLIPRRCHGSIGVFAAVSVATACVLPGSLANLMAMLPEGRVKRLGIEHGSGMFDVRLEVGGSAEKPTVDRVGVVRTARAIFDGIVYPRPAQDAAQKHGRGPC